MTALDGARYRLDQDAMAATIGERGRSYNVFVFVPGIARALGCSAEIRYTRGYPATVNSEREALFAAHVGESIFGKANVFTSASGSRTK